MPMRQRLLVLLIVLLTGGAGFILATSITGSGSDSVLRIVAKVALFVGFAVLIYGIHRHRRTDAEQD